MDRFKSPDESTCKKKNKKLKQITEEIFLAGGCLWGVQEFIRHLPGVITTEAGRANGTSQTNAGTYDGYAECVRVIFDSQQLSVARLIEYLFEIIDPHSVDKQGPDTGRKYRTGVYSRDAGHLKAAKNYLRSRKDYRKIALEVLPLSHYLRSKEAHQMRLARFPDEPCHLPRELLHKYRNLQ